MAISCVTAAIGGTFLGNILRARQYSLLCLRRSLLRQANTQTNSKSYDNANNHNDDETPLPELSRSCSTLGSLVKLNIALLGILQHVRRLDLCLLDWSFLYHNCFSKILEQLVELDECTLDLLNVIVSSSD